MKGGCISELLSLRLSELLQSGWLVDRVPVARRHIKKRTEDRTKLLHSEAKAALAVWLNELNADGELSPTVYVFRSSQADDWPIGRVQDWRKASAGEIAGQSHDSPYHGQRFMQRQDETSARGCSTLSNSSECHGQKSFANSSLR